MTGGATTVLIRLSSVSNGQTVEPEDDVIAWILMLPAWACEHPEPCERACSASPTEETITGQSDREEGSDSKHDQRWTSLRVDQINLNTRNTWGLALRNNGRNDSWIGVEGRWAQDHQWMGRFGLGFDFFGRAPFDLRLGLMAGHIGDWQSETHRRFSVGTAIDLGWHPGRFMLEHRHIGGRRPDGQGLRTEGHTQLGVRPLERLEVYADLSVIDPGQVSRELGGGAGVGWRF